MTRDSTETPPEGGPPEPAPDNAREVASPEARTVPAAAHEEPPMTAELDLQADAMGLPLPTEPPEPRPEPVAPPVLAPEPVSSGRRARRSDHHPHRRARRNRSRRAGPGCAQGGAPAALPWASGVPGGRVRARLAAEAQAQGLRRRHQRPPGRGARHLPQLPPHRPPLPAGARVLQGWEDHRGLHLPRQPDRAEMENPPSEAEGAEDGNGNGHEDLLITHDNVFGTARAGRAPPRLHHQRPVLRRRPRAG